MSDSKVATPTAGRAALYAALSRAQKECRTAELDGRFEGGKVRYPFTSAQERMAVARDALGKHGLAITRVGLPELAQLTMSRELVDTTTGDVKVEEYAQRMLEQRFLLVHESGEALELGFRWPVMEGPGRALDKAWAAADTSGLSYLIRDVLLIPSEESEDLREREGSGGRIVQMPSRPPAPAPTIPAAFKLAPTDPTPTPAHGVPVAAPAPAPSAVAPMPAPPPSAGGAPSETPSATAEGKSPTAPSAPAPPAAEPARPALVVPPAAPDVFDEAIAKQGGPVSELVAAQERAKARLASAPLAAAKLYALQGDVQDKPLYLEVFAVASSRFGSRERAIAAIKELGVPQGTVPTVAQLRQFVEVMP